MRRPSSLGIFLLGLGVVLIAVGAKLALVQRYGTDQPYADQWAAEGMYYLRNPLYSPITFTQLVSFHGEHRPGLMRLWIRGLMLANAGQWDCFVELVANLLIYAAFLAVAWRWLLSALEFRWLAFGAALMAVMFALPSAYENFLWGFQSQFLFLLLLGTLHLYGTLREMKPGVRWGLAQLAGLLSLFSIAAGGISAAVLAVLALVELVRGRRNAWAWSTLVANILIFGLSVYLLPELAPTGSLFERITQTLVGMGHLLAWPFTGLAWCLLLQAPWVVMLASACWKPEEKFAGGDRLVGAMGFWVAGTAFAIAYGRGIAADTIGVRYYDVLMLGLFASVPALIRLITRPANGTRLLWSGFGIVWLASVSFGLWSYNKPGRLAPLFQYQHDVALTQGQAVRDFIASHDVEKFQAFENTSHRFPHFQITIDFLRDPKVPALLPPSLTPDRHENRLSRLARSVAACWTLVLGLGVAAGLLGALRLGKKLPPANHANARE